MKCPQCGNDEFYAHQVLHVDVIVDENGYFKDNCGNESLDIYDAGKPFGPFTCTECGYELDDLEVKL